MSTIIFNNILSRFINNTSTSIVSTGDLLTNYLISGSNTAESASLLLIYKGAIPTDIDLLTDRNLRASDLLIEFNLPGSTNAWNVLESADRVSYTLGINPTATAAVASGVASWFLMCRSGTTSLTDKGALMGTVGLPNSSSDLKIPDVNILQGTEYQSAGLIISFPYTWTVT